MALLFAGGLAISAFTIRRGVEPFDQGLTLQAARRVAEGQVPYRDFLWPYGPALPYLLAGSFKAFGTSLMWWRILRSLVDAAVALVVYVLIRRSAPVWLSLVVWLTVACAMAQPTGANPFAPALLFALLALLVARSGVGLWPALAAGAVCGAAGAFRVDFGVYALAGTLVAVAIAAPARPLAARACGAVAAGFAAITALVYLPFVILDGPVDAWRDVVGRSLRDGRYWRLPFPIGYDGPLRSAKDAKHLLQFYVPLLLLVGLALVLLALALRRRRPRAEVAGLVVLAAGFIAYLLSRTDEFHWAPLLVAIAALVALVAPQAPRAPAVALLVVLAALLAYGAGNRLSALAHPPAMAPLHVAVADGVEAPPAEASAIDAMVRAVQRRVPPGDPIYTITRRSDLVRINDPLIYVLTERDNPARQDFGLQTGAPAQRAIVAVLERSRPRVIVRWTDPISVVREPNARGRPTGVHIVDRWVGTHYRMAERHGYYDVLVPR